MNKSKHRGVEYVFIDVLDDEESFEINRYGELEFENYFYNLIDGQFYLKTHDSMYRRLYINNDRGSEYILMKDINGKLRKININKFKKQYGLDYIIRSEEAPNNIKKNATLRPTAQNNINKESEQVETEDELIQPKFRSRIRR